MENMTIDDKIEKCNMISARGNTPNSRKLREIVYTLFNKGEEYNKHAVSCPWCEETLDEDLEDCVEINVNDTGSIYYRWYCPYCTKDIFTADYYTNGKTEREMLVERRDEVYKVLEQYSGIYHRLKNEYNNIVDAIWRIDSTLP